jgi:GT2 family glycosyltransferase
LPGSSSIGAVIATHQRCEQLVETLDVMSSLPERPAVIVVDNASTDGTAVTVNRRFPSVEVLSLPDNIGAAARNVGVNHLETDIVALTDDDSWWAPGALARAAAVMHRYPRVGLIAAKILVGRRESIDPTCLQMAAGYKDSLLPGPAVTGFVACGCVVRRSAFLQARGFHRRYGIGGEERLLALDLMAEGWHLAYVEDVVAHHHPAARPDSGARRRQTIRNDIWTSWLRLREVDAIKDTLSAVRPGRGAAERIRGFLQALPGLPWVISERSPISSDVERQMWRVARALEGTRTRA